MFPKTLSQELLDEVFSYLSIKDLASLRLTNRDIQTCSRFHFCRVHLTSAKLVLTPSCLQAFLAGPCRDGVLGLSIRELRLSTSMISHTAARLWSSLRRKERPSQEELVVDQMNALQDEDDSACSDYDKLFAEEAPDAVLVTSLQSIINLLPRLQVVVLEELWADSGVEEAEQSILRKLHQCPYQRKSSSGAWTALRNDIGRAYNVITSALAGSKRSLLLFRIDMRTNGRDAERSESVGLDTNGLIEQIAKVEIYTQLPEVVHVRHMGFPWDQTMIKTSPTMRRLAPIYRRPLWWDDFTNKENTITLRTICAEFTPWPDNVLSIIEKHGACSWFVCKSGMSKRFKPWFSALGLESENCTFVSPTCKRVFSPSSMIGFYQPMVRWQNVNVMFVNATAGNMVHWIRLEWTAYASFAHLVDRLEKATRMRSGLLSGFIDLVHISTDGRLVLRRVDHDYIESRAFEINVAHAKSWKSDRTCVIVLEACRDGREWSDCLEVF